MEKKPEVLKTEFVASIVLRDHPCGGGGFELEVRGNELEDALEDLYKMNVRQVKVSIEWTHWVDWGI